MKRSYLLLNVPVVLLGFLIAHATPAPAQICILNELQKLSVGSAELGTSVLIRGDRLLVGISRAVPGGKGSVYVFRRGGDGGSETWTQEVLLTASDGSSNDRFGDSLAMGGSYAVIGASGVTVSGHSRAGAAYVFRLDDNGTPSDDSDDLWIEEVKLSASDAGPVHRFGWSVSISGDYILVGTRLDHNNEIDTGAVYVFRRDDNGTPSDPSDDTWVEQAKLVASDIALGDLFGASVSISGDRLVVGASRHDDAAPFTGSAYIFSRDDNGTPSNPADDVWVEDAKLTASDAAEDALFGGSVGMDGPTVVVGASLADGVGPSSGAVYVFGLNDNGTPLNPNDDTWVEDAKLTPTDVGTHTRFGVPVAVEGDRIVAGAANSSAYVFRLDDNGTILDPQDDFWFQDAKYRATDTDFGEGFGWAVSISGERAAVSARRGATYVFAIPEPFTGGVDCNDNMLPDDCEPDCNGNGIPDECDIAGGTSEDCQPNGTPDECELEAIDCNDNGIPDDCDIAAGTSTDSNGNRIPDECEPPNDDCDDAIELFEGATAFDGLGATSDGPPLDFRCNIYCDPKPCFFHDIWYEFNAPCTTVVQVDVTSESGFIPPIVVNEGCDCPVDPYDSVACRLGFFGDEGPLAFPVEEGVCYKIQVAAFGTLGIVTLDIIDSGIDGACCLDEDADNHEDTCEVLDQDCCIARGGLFGGEGSTCSAIVGACFLDLNGDGHDDTCVVSNQTCCEDQGGSSLGAATTCIGVGACCLSLDAVEICAVEENQAGCDAQGGSFLGAGTRCTAPEACCLGDNTCLVLDPQCCLTRGGTPQGLGSACGGTEAFCDSSTGACYRGDRTCGLANGDAPQGPGTTCGGVEACCLPDDINCLEVDTACCVNEYGGLPQGSGTTCLDSDGDGVADCHDICPGADDDIFAPDCEGAIPTLSEWGLLIMALLLLVGGKTHFGRRRAAKSTA